MAFVQLHIFSEALGMQTEVYVVMPQKSADGEIGIKGGADDKKYKCLYLLHGLSDDHTIWLRRTSIERYAQERGICVVMPFGAKSFYTDMKYGSKYYTYIAKELPKIITEFFNVSDKREDNFIAGLSMGGYGALKIGLKECERFCAAAGLSSVADIENELKTLFRDTAIPIVGEELEVPKEENLFYLAEKQNTNPLKPRIFMGVGTEDFLYEDNLKLKAKFEELDYDYTYRESPGAHSWAFWDEYIQYVLDWML
ncbi:MAG: alpha/beta hydrolase family protein [Clostridiales bacterium]|nr:alpha/beta hydrolase family protein [Clostridiales bacterium]